MKRPLGCTLAACFLAGLVSFGPLACFNGDLPAERELSHPLRSLRFHSKDEVFVGAAPNVSLSRLVGLSAFDGLRPGITAEEAQAIVGPPQRVYQQYGGRDTVYAFPRQAGVVEIFKQAVDSEGFEGFRWFLRWRPVDRNPRSHLSSELLAVLPDLAVITSLHIDSEDGKVTVELDDGLVSAILWLRQGTVEQVPAVEGRLRR
jgi:hypothetical protein